MKKNYLQTISASILATVIFLIAGQTASIRAQTCQPVAPNLISWWSGDDNALDARSRNNGTLQNGTAFTGGQNASGFEFDGVDDAVLLGNPSSLALNSITIETWINKNGNPQNGIENILAKWGFDASLDSYLFGVAMDGRRLRAFGAIGDGVTGDNGLLGGSITKGVWTHLAMTYNAADGINKLYVNGVEVASRYRPNGIFPTSSNVYFGREDSGNMRFFKGIIDELAVYNRALSAAEIQAVYNAGQAGKCKATATVAPSGLVGFWAGDGNLHDSSVYYNHASLANGAGYAVGKVGQGFNLDGNDDYVFVPDNVNQNITGAFSGEAWIYPRGISGAPRIFSKGVSGNRWLLYLAGSQSPVLVLHMETGSGIAQATTTPGSIQLNQWNHVAFTHNYGFGHSIVKLYINGVLSADAFGNQQSVNSSNGFWLGADSVFQTQNFDGIIDEPTIYQSELTIAEIESIYNAGRAGKLKTLYTYPGYTLAVIGDTQVSFTVTAGGTTQVIPLEPSLFPALPAGTAHTGLFYDVSSVANYSSGDLIVCFRVPALPSQFVDLRLLKFENGAWSDVTTQTNLFPMICTESLKTLSPIAVAFS